MVRFSCFPSPIKSNRSKKSVQQSAGAMQSKPQDYSQDQTINALPYYDNNLLHISAEQVTSPSSHDGCWQSDGPNSNSCTGDSNDKHHMVFKKSQSLGSVLDKRRGFSGDDDEMDQGFSFDYSRENNVKMVGDLSENTASAEVDEHGETKAKSHNQHQKNEVDNSFVLIAEPEHHESLFSIKDLNQFHGEQHADVDEHSTDHIVDSIHSSNTIPIFSKSCSVTNLRVDTANSIEGALTPELIGPRSRSFGDLCSLHEGKDESLNDVDTLCSDMIFQRHIAGPDSYNTPESSDLDGKGSPYRADSREVCVLANTSGEFNEVADQERDGKYSSEEFNYDNRSGDEHELYNDDNLVNEWRELENDSVEIKKNLQHYSCIQNWDELTSEEFNIKRIEEWIRQIDFQNGSVVEELGESSSSVSTKDAIVPKKGPQVVAGVATAKTDGNTLDMELACNYISSLSASSSSAQMSNIGLVAVPFLGAYIRLRVLNLSGNAIGRITAGALPRGLHMLNLSKNNISTIEGVRDLTRLRVLDLSCNRIVRIGHGLASCSSLKELYLSGNKISEVEGLHRLLKLNILDLHYNKISTAKGLGQLAANYGSLQAINLEGNPAQKNVGDEQLKKHLLSLLPHLAYYNKQTIRASCSKDTSDCPLRSLASHQFDRGTRTQQNHSRRGSHRSSLHRSSSSNNCRLSPAASSSQKQSKNRQVRLPHAGSKANNHQANLGIKPQSLLPRNPICRSLSEGML